MLTSEKIKTAFERSAKALTLKPSLGQSTGISKARIRNGLTVEIEEGKWKLVSDMPEQAGGNASAPTPGVYGRAAFGSCLAMGYVMQASKLGVPINGVEVEVQADYDDGALFETADVPAGYSEVRYTVTIESDAPEQDILRIIDSTDAHSPYLDVFSRALPCRREVRIIRTKES